MKTPIIIFALLFLFFSCKKEYKNPYDRECPSNIWTPKNLNAIISENGIVISWEQGETHFDGFVLAYSFDSIGWSEVSGGLIDKTSRDYTDTVTYSSPKIFYRIFARADLNVSGMSYSKGLKVQYIKKPECLTLPATNITPTEATLNGTVQANYLSTIVTFEYGTTTNYGSTAAAVESPVNGNTDTNVSINLAGLTSGIIYHFRVKAENSLGIAYGNDLSFISIYSLDNCGTISDADGNIYNTVTIGTQCWMKENLNTTKYNDGTNIPNQTDNNAWSGLTTGAYCDYNNTPANSTTYGRLYNWYAVDNNVATKVRSNGGKNVCPTGWHIPDDTEWTTLTDYLTNNGYGYEGSGSDIGKSMASTSGWLEYGTPGWVGNDQASNNSSGFTALPGGYRELIGTYMYVGRIGMWWSSSEYPTTDAWYRTVASANTDVYGDPGFKQLGSSVRCLRDPLPH
jgi:uncharacterized protein (TIGR02145 family)